MERERLRQIIAEELARALREDVPRQSHPPTMTSSGPLRALLCFSGDRPPHSSLRGSIDELRNLGWSIEAVASWTFRQSVLKNAPALLSDLSVLDLADDEADAALLFQASRIVIFPDISENSLAKATLGIADSLPTRAVASTISRRHACILLESAPPTSSFDGLDRLKYMRQLERRGALLANPQSLREVLQHVRSPQPFHPKAPLSGKASMGRAVITGEDIHEAATRGLRRFAAPPGAIVTDLAKDEARKLGIEIVFTEEQL